MEQSILIQIRSMCDELKVKGDEKGITTLLSIVGSVDKIKENSLTNGMYKVFNLGNVGTVPKKNSTSKNTSSSDFGFKVSNPILKSLLEDVAQLCDHVGWQGSALLF